MNLESMQLVQVLVKREQVVSFLKLKKVLANLIFQQQSSKVVVIWELLKENGTNLLNALTLRRERKVLEFLMTSYTSLNIAYLSNHSSNLEKNKSIKIDVSLLLTLIKKVLKYFLKDLFNIEKKSLF